MMSRKGYDIIYIGHEGHDEAVGTVAEAPHAITLVEPEKGLGAFSPFDEEKVALVAQTTLGLYEWQEVMDDASSRCPSLKTARKSDLCYATTNRQDVVNQLSAECDLILVVGSHNSSNTQALVRVSHENGVSAHRIDSADDIEGEWLQGVTTVGVTAGASAPDHLVQEVIDRLAPTRGFELWSATEEEEYFPLPPQLRSFVSTLQTLVEAGVTASGPGGESWLERDREWTATEALDLISA
jgi:4-hydroxy-3-methylbut-2-enyl diphosphate reductase